METFGVGFILMETFGVGLVTIVGTEVIDGWTMMDGSDERGNTCRSRVGGATFAPHRAARFCGTAEHEGTSSLSPLYITGG